MEHAQSLNVVKAVLIQLSTLMADVNFDHDLARTFMSIIQEMGKIGLSVLHFPVAQ